MTSGRRLAAESVGTALLLAAVVGSGIMGDRLSAGNPAIALLANAVATGATLAALILSFGAVSGAHFNPLVTLAEAAGGGIPWSQVSSYIGAQFIGAGAGVLLAHAMFGESILQLSHHDRSGAAQVLSESVATFGLLTVIWCCARRRPEAVPFAVGLFITGAYWFTASTAFANPAVTAARALTDTFAGIRPADVPAFVFAQAVAAVAAIPLLGWLVPFSSGHQAGATDSSKGTPHVSRRERVLILCTGNSARSQMAEGLLRSFGRGRFDVFSAGTKPSLVRPEAVAVMAELGLDLSSHRSKDVAEFAGQPFDYVITVCDKAREQCPIFPGTVKRLHWSFSDPAAVQGSEAERTEAFRGVRDALAMAILGFVAGRP
jgi:thioredoxin type arsenate reductase